MNALKLARQAAGLTAARLAEMAGTHEMRVYAFERNRHRPRTAEAQRLSEALRCNPEELFPEVFGGRPHDQE